MLDVTGIDAMERPELKHLVTQTATQIENALVLAQSHRLLLRLNWPGQRLGSEADGMVCLDGDGWITAANPVARQMVPQLAPRAPGPASAIHASEVFGIAFELLFDAARHGQETVLEIPLWTGLRLQALPVAQAHEEQPVQGDARAQRSLKDMETALIRKAVEQARGNVAQAAQALGISRATVYRKLGQRGGA